MQNRSTKTLLYASILTALTAVGAWIKIPFYFVPFTLQTLFTILAGSILKPGWAVSSQAVYLLLGLLGLPIFSNGGGIQYIFHPSFGYLVGLPVAAALISFSSHRFSGLTIGRRVAIHVSGSMVILFTGTLYLYFIVNQVLGKTLTLPQAFWTGFILFLPVELLKSWIAAWLIENLYKHEVLT